MRCSNELRLDEETGFTATSFQDFATAHKINLQFSQS